MRLLDRFKHGEMPLGRIEFFSDGVFAIVVTLLVLELKVPALKDHASVSELAHQLVELLPKFLSWLISFIIVCKFWLNHNHMLAMARHADYAMVWLNSIFLMGKAFIPFPTALMGEHPDNRLAVSFFGCVFAVNTLLFIALNAYITRNLIKPELAPFRDPHAVRKGMIGPASYLAGAAAAWWSVHAAFVIRPRSRHGAPRNDGAPGAGAAVGGATVAADAVMGISARPFPAGTVRTRHRAPTAPRAGATIAPV